MRTAALILFALVISVVSTIINGQVICTLWGWFVVPTFHLAPLSVPVAIGLSLLVSYMTYQDMSSVSKSELSVEAKVAQACVFIFIRPALVLLVGLVARSYM